MKLWQISKLLWRRQPWSRWVFFNLKMPLKNKLTKIKIDHCWIIFDQAKRIDLAKIFVVQAKKDELINGAETLLIDLDKEGEKLEEEVKQKTKVISTTSSLSPSLPLPLLPSP